jgi:hypothetical protein
MPIIRLIILGLLLLSLPVGAARGQSPQPAADEPPPAVHEWVAALESDIYTARVRATERLIMAGSRSIEPVAKAVQDGAGLETISRGIYVLRQLAISPSDPETEDQAYQALQQIAQRRFGGTSRRASAALQAIHEMRYHRAQLQLANQGAVFSLTAVQVALGVRDGFPSVKFGGNWHGSPADFAHIAWITGFRSEETDDKWMIIIEDQTMSDEWLDRIAALQNVSVLKFKSVRLSDGAITKLAAMPDLEILEVLYSPLSDASIEQLAALPRIARLRLIGTQITSGGIERLRQLAAQTDIDYRTGGFLGISCNDNPCRITLVQPNSAAAAAGFRVDDVITRYNDQPVQTMDELTRLISQNLVGDKVAIEIQRNDEHIIQEVELGAWD